MINFRKSGVAKAAEIIARRAAPKRATKLEAGEVISGFGLAIQTKVTAVSDASAGGSTSSSHQLRSSFGKSVR